MSIVARIPNELPEIDPGADGGWVIVDDVTDRVAIASLHVNGDGPRPLVFGSLEALREFMARSMPTDAALATRETAVWLDKDRLARYCEVATLPQVLDLAEPVYI